jgi:hypothetical protein
MKKVSIKLALAAILFAVGTLGLNAQNGRGGNTTGTGTASCYCSAATCATQLTADQKLILENLCDEFQADMVVLSAALQATVVVADKAAIRSAMTVLRNEHIAEVKALLTEWGIAVKVGTGNTGSGKKISTSKGTGICIG